MGRSDDEVDCPGSEGRIASAHQLFGALALSLAFDYWLAAIREAGSRATGAWFIVVGHRNCSAKSQWYVVSIGNPILRKVMVPI